MQASVKDSVQISQSFRALSDPLRIEIIKLLQLKEMCVCDLCDQLDTSQSKLSFHLKNLKDAKLVIARQEGRWMYYRLNPEQFSLLALYLSAFESTTSLKAAKPCS
jgi:ArsR family transcriptional regulator